MPHRAIWPRIRRLLTISRLLVWSVIGLAIAIFGNIVANLLQERLGANAWLVALPFAFLAGVYVVGDVYRELRQLDAGEADRRTASRIDPRRAQMIKNVRAIWISGFLDETLYRKKLIALGLTTQPESVVPPLGLRVQYIGQVARPFPTGTRMVKIFDELGGMLLILGAPGAGKTTLLLDLARSLLDRAERTPAVPIPVVFNLASWANQRAALIDWLADELVEVYSVPRTLAKTWVAADQVLPLLDGLDEVAGEHRDSCIAAINVFHNEHGLVPLVVCSRSAEYHELTARLHMHGAVEVRPLVRMQVDEYLAQVGKPLAAARGALRADPALWELLDTPLMLNILTLAYGEKPIIALQAGGTLEERRSRLFALYVERMLRRQDSRARPMLAQTIRWLAWLATQMHQRDQVVFYLEWMQPNWLSLAQQRQYHWGIRLLFWLVFGLVFWLVFGLVVGLGGGLVVGLGGGLVVGLGGGLVVGLGGGLEQITYTETLRWSWHEVRRALVFGLVFELVVALAFGLGGDLGGDLGVALGVALVVGLVFWPDVVLVGGLGDMLSGHELDLRLNPNQGVHRSTRNALAVGLVFWLAVWLAFGLGGVLHGDLVVGLGVGLVVGLVVGLGVGLRYGGRAVIQHAVLRFLLYRDGAMPLNYVRFLDSCAECMLLRKVGGGYVFLHRLLMDYFAALDTEAPPVASETLKTPPRT